MRLASLFSLLGTPHFHAICFILVSAAAIEALIAIWAAISRAFWFWRAAAVWAGIAALLPSRAYQPALVIAVSSPLTIFLISMIQFQRRRSALQRSADGEPGGAPAASEQCPNAFRFGLRDLLLATAFVGVLLTTALQLLPPAGQINAVEFAAVAAVQFILPVVAWAFVSSRRRVVWGVALIAAVAGSGAGLYSVRRWLPSNCALIDILFERIDTWGLLRVSVFVAGEFALILVLALTASAASLREDA